MTKEERNEDFAIVLQNRAENIKDIGLALQNRKLQPHEVVSAVGKTLNTLRKQFAKYEAEQFVYDLMVHDVNFRLQCSYSLIHDCHQVLIYEGEETEVVGVVNHVDMRTPYTNGEDRNEQIYNEGEAIICQYIKNNILKQPYSHESHALGVELSDWIMIDQVYATRVIKNTDVLNVANRIAFIEKSPRVRMKPYTTPDDDYRNWTQGPKGTSDYGLDEESRDWCDNMLILMGYVLPDRK